LGITSLGLIVAGLGDEPNGRLKLVRRAPPFEAGRVAVELGDSLLDLPAR
jgi:hypothetical protein